MCYNPAIANSSQEQDPMPGTVGSAISYTYFYYALRAHRLRLSDPG